MNRVLDILARLPSTNLQALASVIGFFIALIASLASYLVPALDPIPEGALIWIFAFVAGYGGISSAHFAAKRVTHKPGVGEE